MLGRKVIYVRCINCSYNEVAKGISLLDKKAFFVYTGKILCKLELLKDISLNSNLTQSIMLGNNKKKVMQQTT